MSDSDRYLSRKEVSKSYRPRSYVMSPGLLRARAPFRIQNALTGLVLAGFATAVWAYSIRAVKQDDFSDVDDEAREMMKGRESAASPDVGASSEPGLSEGPDVGARTQPRGVLAPWLDRTSPTLLDPTRKTLVWGAPPIDDLGRVRLRGSTEERR
ncbi:hypothetical protein V8E55_001657 [Tylopilus felleus]